MYGRERHSQSGEVTDGYRRGRSTMNIALWIVQGLLAALFLFAGGAKLVLPLDQMAGPVALPGWFLSFIGVADVLGAGIAQPSVPRARCPECLARRGCGPARAIVTPDAPPAVAARRRASPC